MTFRAVWPPLAIGAAFFAVFKIFSAGPALELKVLLNASDPASAYDPAAIVYSEAYFFLENTFSPLLEYSAGDKLVSGAAERFEWAGTEARFRMRAGLKTVDGRIVDAWDAQQSLKRLFILGGPDYDLLRVSLCGGSVIKNLSDPCPGLEVRDGGQTLVMKFKERKTFLFHLLTNISYAVIPKSSVDPLTLKIKDYRNTSGPYYVSMDAGDGRMELRANNFHYRHSADMPQKVEIVPITEHLENTGILKLLLCGKIDYLMGGVVRNPDDKAGFVSANPGYNIHFTQPVRMIYVVFTERGVRRLVPEERFFIGRKLRELYGSRRKICETPDQIFKMEGTLSRQQLMTIRGKLNASGEMVIKKRLEAARLYSYFWLDGAEIKKWMPNIGYADRPPLGDRKNPPGPDFYILGCDIGFQDDVGLLAYYLNMDFFGMTAAEKKKWFSQYTTAPDKKARMKMLQSLHFETLANARVLPVALLPYASVARKPWTFNLTGMVAGDSLWRLRRE